MNKKSILFVNPDYHCSFVYRDHLRDLGWKVDILVSPGYPQKLLFSHKDVLKAPQFSKKFFASRVINGLLAFIHFLYLSKRYHFHIHYGALVTAPSFEKFLLKASLVDESFHFGLTVAKLFGTKVMYIPSGCRDEETRSNFETFDEGNICNNCGFSNRCNDINIIPNLKRVRRYVDIVVGSGFFDSVELKQLHFKYKCIDLMRWQPQDSEKSCDVKKIRILHSHSLETRTDDKLNIKGTPYVLEAMNRLTQEFDNVEFSNISGLTPAEMLFEQQKADIIVDQLIYGYWGSTGIEAMALGKVLVCYVRPEWKRFFFEKFPEHDSLPIAEATTISIYSVLKDLIENESERLRLSKAGRIFAEKQYDPKVNSESLIQILKELG